VETHEVERAESGAYDVFCILVLPCWADLADFKRRHYPIPGGCEIAVHRRGRAGDRPPQLRSTRRRPGTITESG
jgi:hypothetical protein